MFPPFRASYLGAGMVIGTNAITHLVIAQGVALGFLALLGITDWYAWRRGRNAQAWDPLLRRLLTFGVIVSTIGGAVTGAGIWFTIGTLAPRATASMLRVFLWPWFLEWLVFVVEVVSLLILYFAWDWLGRHRAVRVLGALAYSGYSVLSAVLITGILGFMLTVGQWPFHRTLGTAFFNPSFLPQLLARLAIGGIAGGVIGLGVLLVPGLHPEAQRPTLRLFGVFLLVSLAVFVPAVAWYLLVVPDFYTTRKVFAVLTQHMTQTPGLFYGANAVAFLLLLAAAAASILGRIALTRWLVIPGLVAAIGLVAEMERIREFIRGPYLMPSHMYVSEVLLPERFLFGREGMLPNRYWYQRLHVHGDLNQAGAQLFEGNCATCHTVGGINSIRRRVAGRSQDGLEVIIDHTHEMVSFMPPFSGDGYERRVAARFLYRLGNGQAELQSHARMIARGVGP